MTSRQALISWDEFRANVERETPLPQETAGEKVRRIARLEADPEAWFAYHFPHYASAPPAPFHRRATKRIVANKRWYEARVWSRGMAKSTRTMLEVLYLALAKKEIRNILLTSHSESNAIDLLMPYMINLEANQRLINDYGTQKGYRGWETGNFVTKTGVSFRAIGGGQSPRGTKNEHARPDCLLIDDLDHDKLCRNPALVRERWDWVEQALIPTVDVSGNYRIIFCGNYIAPVCIMKEAVEMADYYEVINIRDRKGRSSWPEKNSEKDIDDILSKMSYRSRQKEYFNNPIVEGTVFETLYWDEVPPLTKFEFLIAYGDPSHRDSKKSDYKAVVLIGYLQGKFYVIHAFCDQTTVSKMIGWYYTIRDLVGEKTALYMYVEAGGLQASFYEDTFLRLTNEMIKTRGHISIQPDNRSKPEKFFRIESTLEPLNSSGQLVFNVAEKQNPHMMTLKDQFLAINPKLNAHDDGPDATEGGVWLCQRKSQTRKITGGKYRRRKYRR
jgi:phage terminase large subunit-like protein